MQNKNIYVKKKHVLVDQAKIKSAVRDAQQGEGNNKIVDHVIGLWACEEIVYSVMRLWVM